jgi:hypothetical protein
MLHQFWASNVICTARYALLVRFDILSAHKVLKLMNKKVGTQSAE